MHVLREAERASSKKRLGLTVRLDDVALRRHGGQLAEVRSAG
jgi:hypothetical protein